MTELADMRRAYEAIEEPNEETVAAAREVVLAGIEEAIGREQVARRRTRGRRQRLVVLAAAALVVVVVTASAFGTVRELFFGTSRTVERGAHIWSPDGQMIASVAYRYPEGLPEVYVMDAWGTRPQRNLTSEWGRNVFPIWSPYWEKVAFVSNPCEEVEGACTRTRHIYVMNADGSGVQRLARGGTVRKISGQRVCPCAPLPEWSPDGRKIAFGSERDGSVELYLMNADGSGQRRLTRNGASESSLAWSPGGRWIVFVRRIGGDNAPPRRQEIWVMNADGSGQRRLARGHAPAWSPNGRKIAFRSDRDGNGEIYVVNTDGSGLRRLTRNPASDGGPVWSPNGRRIAFERFRNGNTDIWVMNADGSGQQNLTPEARPPRRARDSSPAWSPDGRRIAFATERDGNGEIYVMNADGSDHQNLTRLKEERFSRTVGNVSFSFSVPAGWSPGPLNRRPPSRTLYVSQDIVAGQAAEAVIFWAGFPDGGYPRPCPSLLRRRVGPSSADLANAVATAPGTELVKKPSRVTVGGRPAKHVVVTVREDVGCDPGFFYTWRDEMWGPFWSRTEVGDTIRVWIVDVGGTRVFFEAETRKRAGFEYDHEQLEQEIQGIVDSIRFD